MLTLCSALVLLCLAIPATGDAAELWVSNSPARTAPTPLAGAVVSGDVYIYATPPLSSVLVRFFVDGQSVAQRTELYPPYDLEGTLPDGTAGGLNTRDLADGTHLLSVEVTDANNQLQRYYASFVVANNASASAPSTAGSNALSARGDTASTVLDTPVTIDVLTNDVGMDNPPFNVTVSAAPANGTTTVGVDGSIVYRPDAGYVGNDSFLYRVQDALGNTSIATATVRVTMCTGCGSGVSVVLSWAPSSGTVQGYRVYYGQQGSTADQLVSDLPLNSGLIQPSAPKVTLDSAADLGLAPGQEACFRIRAYNNAGTSSFSQPVCSVL